jgi:hypothetical protein
LNHAVHMVAVTQVAHRHGEGRAYYDRKLKEGKTNKEALRCLKRRISDAIFGRLVADAKSKAKVGPGGQRGNGSVSSVAGSHPERQLFGEATPGPEPAIGPTPEPMHILVDTPSTQLETSLLSRCFSGVGLAPGGPERRRGVPSLAAGRSPCAVGAGRPTGTGCRW